MKYSRNATRYKMNSFTNNIVAMSIEKYSLKSKARSVF